MRKLLWILAVLVLLFGAIQLIPVSTTNPPVTREVKWDSAQTRALAQRACFDCHSNETVWPWYAKIAPVKFLLARDASEGRARLNFSEWDKSNPVVQELEYVITSGKMPLWDYTLMHPAARLTADEKAQLISGLKATFQQDPPVGY